MMSASIRSTTPHFEKQKVARFHRLDTAHISAIESLYKSYPFLKQRVEIHMPYHCAKIHFHLEKYGYGLSLINALLDI